MLRDTYVAEFNVLKGTRGRGGGHKPWRLELSVRRGGNGKAGPRNKRLTVSGRSLFADGQEALVLGEACPVSFEYLYVHFILLCVCIVINKNIKRILCYVNNNS